MSDQVTVPRISSPWPRSGLGDAPTAAKCAFTSQAGDANFVSSGDISESPKLFFRWTNYAPPTTRKKPHELKTMVKCKKKIADHIMMVTVFGRPTDIL